MRKYDNKGQKILSHINTIMKKHYSYLDKSDGYSTHLSQVPELRSMNASNWRKTKRNLVKKASKRYCRRCKSKDSPKKKKPREKLGDLTDRSYSLDYQNASVMFYSRNNQLDTPPHSKRGEKLNQTMKV